MLIVGDFNAKVGRDQCYRNIIENPSLHTTSHNNGTKLIDFATGKGLINKSIHRHLLMEITKTRLIMS